MPRSNASVLAPATVTAARGKCGTCNTRQPLRKNGTVANHKRENAQCAGSGSTAVDISAEAGTAVDSIDAVLDAVNALDAVQTEPTVTRARPARRNAERQEVAPTDAGTRNAARTAERTAAPAARRAAASVPATRTPTTFEKASVVVTRVNRKLGAGRIVVSATPTGKFPHLSVGNDLSMTLCGKPAAERTLTETDACPHCVRAAAKLS